MSQKSKDFCDYQTHRRFDMIYGIQIIGVLFALVMIYLTFLFYKKRAYNGRSYILWTGLWIFFLFIVAFPNTLYGIMETLEIKRTVDFFVITAFLFFSVVIFYLYVIVKRSQKMLEEIVRKVALKK